MQYLHIVFLLFLFLTPTNTYLWDNILSQTNSPISMRLSQSFFMQFAISGLPINGFAGVSATIDYSHPNSILTFKIENKAINLLAISINFNSSSIISQSLLQQKCKIYHLNQIIQYQVSDYRSIINLFFIFHEIIYFNGNPVALYQFKAPYNLAFNQLANRTLIMFALVDIHNGKIIKAYADRNLSLQLSVYDQSLRQQQLKCPDLDTQQISIQDLMGEINKVVSNIPNQKN